MEEIEETRAGVPIAMPISAVVLLILGFVAMPIISNNATEEQLARNVILSAIPFILIFASIVVAFMSIVWYVASRLNDNISEQRYRPIEMVLIGGILLGVILIFQPWIFQLFRVGFFLLLASTIGFILWSHVRPKAKTEEVSDAGEGESGLRIGG